MRNITIGIILTVALALNSCKNNDADLGLENPYSNKNMGWSSENKNLKILTKKKSNQKRTPNPYTRKQNKANYQRSKGNYQNYSNHPVIKNKDLNIPKLIPQGNTRSYSSVSTDKNIIAITFDDGPHPSNTPRLLKILADRNIKATFYVIGENARAYPHIIRSIKNQGHELGNHTYTHPSLTKLSNASIESQLTRTAHTIYSACGEYPRTVRPPFGAINSRVRNVIAEKFGYPTIMWSVDPNDWKRPGVSVVTRRIVNGTRPGAIILVHDIHKPSIDAMPGTLDSLLNKGFQFVTISQLLNI